MNDKMDTSSSTPMTKSSRTRSKASPGWAAFDLKHRKKQQHQVDRDPFPPIPSSGATSLHSNGKSQMNYSSSARSFSSVVVPHVEFPNLKDNSGGNILTQVGDKVPNEDNHNYNYNNVLKKLKELHEWAEDSLIADVAANVGGDVDKASTLLEEMISVPSSRENNRTQNGEFQFGEKTNPSAYLDETVDFTTDIADLSSTLEEILKDNQKDSMVESASEQRQLSDKVAANMKLILGHLRCVPPEPEWEEEDDVYLIHRRNARRMMRFASQHSRAATHAYLLGDHLAAQQHSLKAREEWLDGEKLNSEAAKEILRIRNFENDNWKLDLHGLHAGEAVQALQEHLQKIETEVTTNQFAYKNIFKDQKDSLSDPSFDLHVEKYSDDTQNTFRQKRPTVLEVITGVGKHSRGQAALPTTVRSFLIENGYRFDEPRPGVVAVKPKFHRRYMQSNK